MITTTILGDAIKCEVIMLRSAENSVEETCKVNKIVVLRGCD